MEKRHEIRLDEPAYPFDRFFQAGIASCHAYLTLREDYRAHVRRVQREIGFRRIRFHGIFTDLVGPLHFLLDDTDGPRLNFQNVTRIYRFFVEQGMKPFVELGFMPSRLASGDKTCFAYRGNITPPADWAQWARLVRRFTAHLVEVFGLNEVRGWHFEVWNEPDLTYFWSGTQEDYFRLYAESARAVKSVDERLKVGGPATSGCRWIQEFAGFCAANRVPLDFFSTHDYNLGVPLGLDGRKKVGAPEHERRWLGRLSMPRHVEEVKAQVRASAFPDAEIHFTEWNSSPVHADTFGKDSEFNAAYVLETLKRVSGVDSFMFWTVSDIFEESGLSMLPFTGKYGLVNFDGVPKPVYHAYRWLAAQYDEEIPGTPEWCRVTRGPGGALRVLAWHLPEVEKLDLLGGDWTLSGAEPRRETLCLTPARGRYRVVTHAVDRRRGNGLRAWQALGAPAYPAPSQQAAISAAAETTLVADTVVTADGCLPLVLELPGCGALYCDITPL